MRIYQLDPAVANQIAAGEVIERPASVVKELLENSFDAGADSISIEIGYGGLNQIKISDNGSGILAEDLPLALAAHATSKIKKLDDLYAIDSMGFRGEALASIASIAKVTLSSKPQDQEHAMMLRVRGAQMECSPCARNTGTTIDVSDIFFNAPVRKRFLKSEKLEFQAIETVVKRFALSAPHIALSLKHNGKLVLALPQAVNEQTHLTRVSKLFGSSFIKEAVFLDVEHAGMHLRGWLSGPTYQRSQSDKLWVYINQRMVKDKLINHALKQTYDGLLHPGRFPACLLYFTLDTKEVDVNVHPTKHEVRFQQPRLIHDFFTSQLSRALKNNPSKAEPSYCIAPDVTQEKTEICEPYAYPSFSAHALRPAVAFDSSWIILNQTYVLVFIHGQPHIVDSVALYKKWLRNQVHALSMPLESRPLLVPIRYSLPACIGAKYTKLQGLLAQLGMDIQLLKEDKVLIRSVPIHFPNIHIQLFWESLTALDDYTLERLSELMVQSHSYDPGQLKPEERTELMHMLLNGQAPELLCKSLTEDDCRMFLHV